MLEPELLIHVRPLEHALVGQPAQVGIQIDLDGAGAVHDQGIIFKRLSQSLSDVRAASAHAPQVDAEPTLARRVLEQLTQFRFGSRGQLQSAITSALRFLRAGAGTCQKTE